MTINLEAVTRGLPMESPVHLYCRTAALAEEARQAGSATFAVKLEAALDYLLAGLPHAEQTLALMLSLEISAGTETGTPTPPHLRLVHSRE